MTPGTLRFFLQALLEIPAVVETGQRVGQTQPFQPFAVQHVFKAQGHDGGKPLEEIRPLPRFIVGRIVAADGQQAQQAVLAYQRQHGGTQHRSLPRQADLHFMADPPQERIAASGRKHLFQCAGIAQQDQSGRQCLVQSQDGGDVAIGIGHHQQGFARSQHCRQFVAQHGQKPGEIRCADQ